MNFVTSVCVSQMFAADLVFICCKLKIKQEQHSYSPMRLIMPGSILYFCLFGIFIGISDRIHLKPSPILEYIVHIHIQVLE